MRRRCVTNKNRITRSKVKIIVCTLHLLIGFGETCSCPSHNFVMNNGIYKLFSTIIILTRQCVAEASVKPFVTDP